jgi:hypothetical protein
MRLINFGVGEITDRLSILSLKILHSKPGVDNGHFTAERSQLLGKLAGRSLNGAWFEQAMELSAVNAAIWKGEDDLRELRRGSDTIGPKTVALAAGEIGMRLQELNDRRHELIEEINKKSGEFFGSEKVTTEVTE